MTPLARHVREHRLGAAFLAETGFVLARDPDNVRAPDIAFVRHDRLPDPPTPGYFPGAPDLAVEITSPNDTFTEVHEKSIDWLEHGADMVWVVDPVARRATVYRGVDDVRIVSRSGELTGEDVVPGFAMPLHDLWPDSHRDGP